MLRFEADPAKAAENLKKHGVSFEEAQTVFYDDYALFLEDPDHSTTEAVSALGAERQAQNPGRGALLPRSR